MEDLKSLIICAQAGDLDAFGAIVQRFQDMAVGYAYSILGNFHLAEDAAQEAFIGAWSDLPQLREPDAFPGWFRKIIFKHCDRLTRGMRIETVPLEAAVEMSSEAKDPAEAVLEQEMRDAVLAAIGALPENQRMVTTLFYSNGYSQNEIAEFLEIPRTTVDHRLRASRKRLKKRMIYMAKKKLREETPSRDEKFASKIKRMIKPRVLKTTEFRLFGKVAGTDIWEMLCAALKGDLQTIQQLVEKNPDLVECQYNYTQPIHFAVREGHVDVVSYLLEHGANPSYRTYFFGDSLLTLAADRGHDAVVQILEEALRKRDKGFSAQAADLVEAVSGRDHGKVRAILGESPQLVNASDPDGATPLHRAVNDDHFYMVRYLIDKGADVNAQRSDGFRPIHLAFYRNNYWVRKDNLLMVGYLLAKGAEYNINTAAALGDLQQVQEFLQDDPSLANFNDSCRKRPISAAAERGYAEIVKLLLEHRADPNAPEAQAPKGYTLWAAVRGNQIDIARALLEHGADPNAVVESSGPPLAHAEGDMYELLLEHGAQEPHPFFTAVLDHDVAAAEQLLKENLDLVNRDDFFWGEGVMSLPAKRAQFDMLNLLLRYGARVPDVSKWGQSYYFNHYDVAKFLLENGMNPNHRNWLQITPLHDMAAAGNFDKAKLLLDFGADINPRDEEYCSTPLGLAARRGRKEMVGFLLERGAATNLPDDEPWATPLAWAEKNVHTEIAEILRKHGANR